MIMHLRFKRPLCCLVVVLPALLAGCSKDNDLMRGFRSAEITGSIRTTGKEYPTFAAAVLAGKTAFRNADYGLSQTAFQRAVELNARSGEAWLGLAASYDRLRRFDMADRAYGEAFRIVGERAEYYNNVGYSYLLRGDLVNARKNFGRARALDPDNIVVEHNVAMLRASIGYTSPD